MAILREIRDEIRSTRVELKSEIAETNKRLDGVNERVDGVNARLETVEVTLKDLAGQQLILTRYIKNVVDRHDTDIDELRERVTRLETRLDERT